jgi:hypothetical protein
LVNSPFEKTSGSKQKIAEEGAPSVETPSEAATGWEESVRGTEQRWEPGWARRETRCTPSEATSEVVEVSARATARLPHRLASMERNLEEEEQKGA